VPVDRGLRVPRQVITHLDGDGFALAPAQDRAGQAVWFTVIAGRARPVKLTQLSPISSTILCPPSGDESERAITCCCCAPNKTPWTNCRREDDIGIARSLSTIEEVKLA